MHKYECEEFVDVIDSHAQVGGRAQGTSELHIEEIEMKQWKWREARVGQFS